ncbi:ABC transporter ATP-binding protein [Micromonospora zhanjiangensis]|uniref:ABC transporter ATP-binding protein n=1 Tax=Micromonospora zhanjiangensis TaxID=1522057 RepID=A0ABV8KF53_9ACTN
MIELHGVSKRFGDTLAVDDLTFRVLPGRVTGFLGPNGAGKTTTMRMILGLNRPTAGTISVGGRRYVDLPAPLREVGALLDARAVHGSRTAYHHLLCLARSNGIGRRRVREVLALVGLERVAGKRAGTFSLGMSQRLGIAAALLGDPGVLMFDEPVNGLDPEGVRWLRDLIRGLAGEGRTVLMSSHLMSEMALTADHLVVVGRGRLIADATMDDFVRANTDEAVLVRTPEVDRLTGHLTGSGAAVHREPDGALVVSGLDATAIGRVALTHGLPLTELTPRRASLEDVFMALTRDAVEYASKQGATR